MTNMNYEQPPCIGPDQPGFTNQGFGPQLCDVSWKTRDMGLAASGLIDDVRKTGAFNIASFEDIPQTHLTPEYFSDPGDLARNTLRQMTEQGRQLALYAIGLWVQHRGFQADDVSCMYYPELMPGAQSFMGLWQSFELTQQLPPTDLAIVRQLYSISVAKNSPEIFKNLIPE